MSENPRSEGDSAARAARHSARLAEGRCAVHQRRFCRCWQIMRRSSGEYCDLAPPTVAVVAPTELALVDALEKKHASLERKIVAAEASVRQKEVELHEKIAAAESRVDLSQIAIFLSR